MAPSDRHTELRNMAATWIGNRALKKCALPEAPIVGYAADLVVVAGMNGAEHSKRARHAGLQKKTMVGRYEVRGDLDRWWICVFEIKVSRADFLNTFGGKDSPHAKARMVPVGTFHWVVADKGVCKPEEVPDFWGLLTPYGSGLSERKVPKVNVLSEADLHSIAFDLFWMSQNYRGSYYDQLEGMAKAVQSLNRAIIIGCEREEILRLSATAVTACQGFQ